MNFRRVVEINNPRQEEGATGYLIRDNLILTVCHIVDLGDAFEDSKASYGIRFIGDYLEGRKEGSVEKCCLCWVDPVNDLALLRIESGRPKFLSDTEPAVRFGKLGYQMAQQANGCGFPTSQEIEDRQNPLELHGYLSWLNALKENQLQLEITRSVPSNPNEWKGVSGAALFVGDLLIGVVVETNKGSAKKALWAAPISAIANDPSFCKLVCGTTNKPLSIEEVGIQNVPQREKIESKLLENIRKEVDSRIKLALIDDKRVDIRKSSMSTLIRQPQIEKVKFTVKNNTRFLNASIVDIFNSINGRLLILGEPGSGKTTELLLLTERLIYSAEMSVEEPIPIIFELSSWNDKDTIGSWLEGQLKLMYPFLGNRANSLMNEYKIIPLLDGLDELNPKLQTKCIQAINRFFRNKLCPQHVVICCRYEAYKRAVSDKVGKLRKQNLLRLDEAILLKKLSREQVRQYLSSTNQPEIWKLAEEDKELISLLQVPLFLSMLRFID